MDKTAVNEFLDDTRLGYLTELLQSVKSASTVSVGQKIGDAPANTTGVPLIRPGGRDCYPAFWIRDFSMSLASGCMSSSEMLDALLLTASRQCDRTRDVPTGGLIPAGAIPDHINFDGTPIYYPGTYDPETQGGGPWGILPSLDDHFYFVEMAWEYTSRTNDMGVLRREVEGKEILQRLEAAFDVPPRDAETGLVCCAMDNRGVSFGFTDSVTHTENLLFCSLLACRAARHLGVLFADSGKARKAAEYESLYTKLKESISIVFACPDGYLKASTGLSAQADVWGTAFAVYEGLLLPGTAADACDAILRGYRAGAISWRGNIRHVPTTHDFSEHTAWERTADVPINTYQNGAYWNTATGWVAHALAQRDLGAAKELINEYVNELEENDFRKGGECGSPWECIHPANGYTQNPVYLTSVSCPVAALQRISSSRHSLR